jgi:hypothetical protein
MRLRKNTPPSQLDNQIPMWKMVQQNEQQDAERLKELNAELGEVKIREVKTVTVPKETKYKGETKIMATTTKTTKGKANTGKGKTTKGAKSTPKVTKVIEPEVIEPKDYKTGREDAQPQAIAVYAPKNTDLAITSGAVQMIKDIETRDDDELVNMLRGLSMTETAIWVVLGAATFEIIERAQKEGFRQQRVAGGGLNAFVNDVARETGVDWNTLWQNYKIYSEFRVELRDLLEKSPEQILPKEFYKQALRAPVPAHALNYFVEKRAALSGSYNMLHAKRDADKAIDGKKFKQIDSEDIKERNEAVKAKANTKKAKETLKASTKEAKVEMIPLQLHPTDDNVWRIQQIVEKYTTFEQFFIKACDEMVGVPPVKPELETVLDGDAAAADTAAA